MTKQHMSYIKFEELESIREKHRNEKIVLCGGCFDVTHAGHILFLEDCKKLGDILIVMVGSDAVVKRDKTDKRPIMNESLRMKMIDSLKPVDYTFLDYIPPNPPHPLYVISMALEKLKPDTYVVNKDAWDIPYREQFSREQNVPLIILDREAPPEFEDVSTTKIINKIKAL